MTSAESTQPGADYEQLAEFVDAILAEKYPGEPISNHQALRDQAIQDLSDRIDVAIYSALTDEQRQALDQVVESTPDDPAAFLNFFTRSGIKLNQIIQDTTIAFGNELLGGSHE